MLAWVTACGPNVLDKSSADAKPPRNADALVAQAQDLLRRAMQPDYRAPVANDRVELRVKAANLYREACELTHDVSPCVWAISLAVLPTPSAEQPRVTTAIDILAAQCLRAPGGEACRIFDDRVGINANTFSDPKAWCDKGLALACEALASDAADEQAAQLHKRSCQLGDPRGCEWEIARLDNSGGTRAQIIAARAEQLRLAEERCTHHYPFSCELVPDSDKRGQVAAVEGCARGYLAECGLVFEDRAVVERQLAYACALVGSAICSLLANLRTDPVDIRDALEHRCQLRDADRQPCVDLVKGYRAKTYPEPVPGRVDTIVRYFCTRGEMDFDEERCKSVTQ